MSLDNDENLRIAALEKEVAEIKARLASGDVAITQLQTDLEMNTNLTQTTASNTAEIVEFFKAFQGAWKVLNWIGSLAKPIGYIAGMAAAFWGLFHVVKTGAPPK